MMNASGPHSAEKAELLELAAHHRGAIVFKSCNQAGLDKPDNLKNRGVAHFVGVAGELIPRGKAIVGSVVGNTEDEIVSVATTLDRAGANILELNLADDYVMNSVAPFASSEKLRAIIGRVRAEIGAALAVKLPPRREKSFGLEESRRALEDQPRRAGGCAYCDLRTQLGRIANRNAGAAAVPRKNPCAAHRAGGQCPEALAERQSDPR